MKSFPSKSISDNRKSKACPEPRRRIENLKWVGIVTIALTFAFSGVEALAQPQSKVAKIGWLGARSASAPAREVFERELRALGYAEGKNITFEYRYAESL
jgi:HD superfamily phosphodiesterase